MQGHTLRMPEEAAKKELITENIYEALRSQRYFQVHQERVVHFALVEPPRCCIPPRDLVTRTPPSSPDELEAQKVVQWRSGSEARVDVALAPWMAEHDLNTKDQPPSDEPQYGIQRKSSTLAGTTK